MQHSPNYFLLSHTTKRLTSWLWYQRIYSGGLGASSTWQVSWREDPLLRYSSEPTVIDARGSVGDKYIMFELQIKFNLFSHPSVNLSEVLEKTMKCFHKYYY